MAGSGNPPIYVIDSSSWGLINGNSAQERIQARIIDLIDHGKVRIPPALKVEMEQSEFVHTWLSSRYDLMVDTPIDQDADYLALVGKVTAAFPGMSAIRSRKTKADPWVVAYAAHQNSVHPSRYYLVVCDETTARRPNRKIPTACGQYGVEPLGLDEMLRREFPDEEW